MQKDINYNARVAENILNMVQRNMKYSAEKILNMVQKMLKYSAEK